MTDPQVQREAGWGADASDVGVKPLPLPLSVQQQQLQLARKQQLVQAMMNQQLQDKGGTQMAGNIAIKKSPFEALSQALSAGILANKQKELDERGTKIGEDYNALGQREMQQYMDTANGTPGDPRTFLPEDQSGPQDKGTPKDPQRALTEGLMAQNADVRAVMIAKQKQQDAMQKMMAEKAMGAGTPDSVIKAAQQGTIGTLAPKKELVFQSPNSVARDKDTGEVAPALPQGQRMELRKDSRGGDIVFNPTTGNAEMLDKAPKITNINAGTDQGKAELYKKTADAVVTDGQLVKKAKASNTVLDRMEQDSKSMFDGTAAGKVAFVSNLAATMGVPVDREKLANTQSFDSQATQIWQDIIAKQGGNKGVTAQEAEEIRKQVPQLINSPEGRAKLLANMRSQNNSLMAQYNDDIAAQQTAYAKDPQMQAFLQAQKEAALGKGWQPQQAGMPAAPQQQVTPTTPMSASEYLKQNRR